MSRDALELAVAALARKERTTAELAELLRSRGCDDAEVEDTLDHLTAIGELDDERFARRYAEDKRELRGWGPDRIAEALRRRGLAEAAIGDCLGSDDHAAQVQRATALLARRGESVGDEAARARGLAFLLRRGYGKEVAYEAVRAAERSPEAA